MWGSESYNQLLTPCLLQQIHLLHAPAAFIETWCVRHDVSERCCPAAPRRRTLPYEQKYSKSRDSCFAACTSADKVFSYSWSAAFMQLQLHEMNLVKVRGRSGLQTLELLESILQAQSKPCSFKVPLIYMNILINGWRSLLKHCFWAFESDVWEIVEGNSSWNLALCDGTMELLNRKNWFWYVECDSSWETLQGMIISEREGRQDL